MPLTRHQERSISGGASAGLIGVTAAPRRQAANTATTSSTRLGSSRPTTSPRSTPNSASRVAAVRTAIYLAGEANAFALTAAADAIKDPAEQPLVTYLRAAAAIAKGRKVAPGVVAMVVPGSARQNALGRQLDPAAYLVSRPWVSEHVLIVLDDPEDPTPYWLTATRHPERLAEAINAGSRSASDRGDRV